MVLREIPIGALGNIAPRLNESADFIQVTEPLVPENSLLGATIFLVGIVWTPTRCDMVHSTLNISNPGEKKK